MNIIEQAAQESLDAPSLLTKPGRFMPEVFTNGDAWGYRVQFYSTDQPDGPGVTIFESSRMDDDRAYVKIMAEEAAIRYRVIQAYGKKWVSLSDVDAIVHELGEEVRW